jgi:hypothetical protein
LRIGIRLVNGGSVLRADANVDVIELAAARLSIATGSSIGVGELFNKWSIAIDATRTWRFLRVGTGANRETDQGWIGQR